MYFREVMAKVPLAAGRMCSHQTNNPWLLFPVLMATWLEVSAGTCVVVSVLSFFRAEDGIRDATVTGVQTCALPIYPLPPPDDMVWYPWNIDRVETCSYGEGESPEERRVGKECRSRWSPYH